jgi:hypothetical protein
MTDKVKFKPFPTAFKLAAIKRLESGEARAGCNCESEWQSIPGEGIQPCSSIWRAGFRGGR